MWQEKIQEELKRKQMTQEDLAIDADLSQSAISAFLSGRKKPSLDSLEKMATALDMDLSQLFDKTHIQSEQSQKDEFLRLKTEIYQIIESSDLSQIHSLSLLLSISRKFLR
ncbi:helix-turn-helix domain-containing protein (plasmid) [Photobacterium leiognathi subsp. mandapamensis]|uniref:helix-turn-helix domain-containing protein n=1 Tax=Photobacterium leiognathi TaxID=553611 RepID=UPI003AF335F4